MSPASTGLRRAVERRSAPLLVFLSAQPKLAIPVVSVLLLIGGLALPPAGGAICLALLLVLVGWLSYLSWPAVVGPARLVRVATVALVLFALVQRLAF
jgi:hypothetical protein